MEKHFELTDETIEVAGNTLHRIRCTRDCKWAKTGDLGGFIEKEDNLSGNAWVYDNAQVAGNARVYDNAQVAGTARVSGNARVYDNARVAGNARVSGNAWVSGTARVSGNARVYDNAQVAGNAWVSGNAQVAGNARVSGNAWVYDNARVSGNAWVYDNAQVAGNARIDCIKAHCGFDVFGSCGRHTHAYITAENKIEITCGCFRGSIEEFEAKVRKTHGDNQYAHEYLAIIYLIKIKFGLV